MKQPHLISSGHQVRSLVSRIPRFFTVQNRLDSLKMLPLLLVSISLFCTFSTSNYASVFAIQNKVDKPYQPEVKKDVVAEKCASCRLTSQSIEDLVRKPRQMDAYGQMADKIDLEKIKKTVCKDLLNDKERESCRNFFFTYLETVQKWKHSNTKTSFFDFVCIKELKLCCPRNSHGPKCAKCMQCGPNEHCHGEGTRSGNGSCICKEGYTGLNCATCSPGYYQENNNNNLKNENLTTASSNLPVQNGKVLCRTCHKSCVYCRHEGPLGCDVCRSGFSWLPAYGCSDIDECIKDRKICGKNTFCVNTEGSYFCYECDRACDGCHGDGPDMCLRCAEGYKLDKNGNCVALKKTILPPEANYYRYGIYVGMLICTGIILHNNVFLAGLVGLGVSLYIGFSEYVMNTHVEDMNSMKIS